MRASWKRWSASPAFRSKQSIALSPKATNSIAGGNATGTVSERRSDPERVEYDDEFDPFRVGNWSVSETGGVATGY